jgi:hypothetical protein
MADIELGVIAVVCWAILLAPFAWCAVMVVS